MAKAAVQKTWALPLRSDGQRYSRSPISPPTAIARTVNSATQVTLTASGGSSSLGTNTGYRYRRNGALLNASPTADPYVDTGLTANTTYQYTATLIDSAGNESAISEAFAATTSTTSDTVPPTVAVITATASSASTIVIGLTTPSTDAGSGFRDYTLQVAIAAGGPWNALQTGISSAAFPITHTGLTPASTRHYRLVAFDQVGNSSISGVVNATTLASDAAGYYGGPELGFLTPTIYAGPTSQGNGSGSSEANCTTLTAALSSASAGARIGVLPGVYSKAPGNSRFTPAWTTSASGTQANPIIIVAKYSAVDLGGIAPNGQWAQAAVNAVFAHPNRSELRHTGSYGSQSNGSPTLGAWDRNFVYFIGFCVDELNANSRADTGPAVLIGVNGSRIARCVLQGRPVDSGWAGDNHPGIRMEGATNPAAHDNVITGFRYYGGPSGTQNGSHNHCGIQRYDCVGTDVRNNFSFNNHTNIYLKDQDSARGETVFQNYCMNPEPSGANIEVLNTNEGSVSDITVVSQNLCVGGNVGLMGQADGRNIKWRNNTVVGAFTGGGSAGIVAHYQTTGGEISDNLFVATSGSTMIDEQFRTSAVIPSNRNHFHSTGGSFTARYNGQTYSSLAAWRAATSQDLQSTQGDPLFVGGGSYKLSPGSPALTGSSNGNGPRGCYITGNEVIGPRYVS